MNDRDVSAILQGVAPVLREHFDGLARRLSRDAEQAEALRVAEHRAFMAEQREAAAERGRDHQEAMRVLNERIATLRDGVDGNDGAPGRDGTDGKDGSPGADGRDGVDGKDGAAGIDGQPGRDGADGNDGAPGADGGDGADGAPGADGRDGIDGKDGQNGIDGVNGADGAPGRDGIDGTNGRDGVDGIHGKDGRDGIDGRDGSDAYHGEARGLFDPEASYRSLDVVSFNGSEWRAKSDDPGTLPGPGWMLSASRGKRGEKGDRGDHGRDGATGASVVARYLEGSQLIDTLSDGTEIKADLSPIIQSFAEGHA